MQIQPQEILWVVGRLLLGGLFVAGGIRHFFIIPGTRPAAARPRTSFCANVHDLLASRLHTMHA